MHDFFYWFAGEPFVQSGSGVAWVILFAMVFLGSLAGLASGCLTETETFRNIARGLAMTLFFFPIFFYFAILAVHVLFGLIHFLGQ